MTATDIRERYKAGLAEQTRRDYPHSPPDALWRSEHYVNGFPDFSSFDDTIEDAHGWTDRARAMAHYYDLLDQRRE